MSTNKHLKQLTYNTTEGSDGIVVSQDIPLNNWYLASSGAALTTTLATNPGQDKFGTNMTGLAWAAGVVVPAGITFSVPRDYDETSDHLKIRFYAKSAGSTDTPTIDCTAYISDDPTTDLNPTASAALSSTLAWVEIDLSSNGLSYGDSVEIQPFPGTHATDAVEVWHSEFEYKSMIVANDPDERE